MLKSNVAFASSQIFVDQSKTKRQHLKTLEQKEEKKKRKRRTIVQDKCLKERYDMRSINAQSHFFRHQMQGTLKQLHVTRPIYGIFAHHRTCNEFRYWNFYVNKNIFSNGTYFVKNKMLIIMQHMIVHLKYKYIYCSYQLTI